MSDKNDNTLVVTYCLISEILSAVIFLSGIAVLVGWIFDIGILKSVMPGLVTMKANTAICFACTGASLWCLQKKRADVKKHRIIARCLGILVLAVSAATICEYAFGWNLGIDELLFSDPSITVLSFSPGRMALNTAVNFFLIGLALNVMDVKTRGGRYPAHYLFTVEGMIALVALIGYVYGTSTFYFGIAKYEAMALHTAVLFVMIFVAAIVGRAYQGEIAMFADRGPAGYILRRLIPGVFVCSILVDMLALYGARTGLYDSIFANALHSATVIMVYIGLTLFVARVLFSEGSMLQVAESARLASERNYRAIFESSKEAMMILAPQGRFINGNKATLDLFGCKDEEEFTSKTPAELSPEYQPDGAKSSDKAAQMMDLAMRDGSAFFEWKHMRLSGEEFWAVVLLTKLELSGLVVLQATVRDIDEKKRIELELVQKMADLEIFQKVTMGREKKIIELKEKVAELEAKLASQDDISLRHS